MKRSMELEIEINKLRQTALDDDATAETIAEIRSAVDLATQKRTVALEIEGAEQEAAEAKVAEQRAAEGHQDTETAETTGSQGFGYEGRNEGLPTGCIARRRAGSSKGCSARVPGRCLRDGYWPSVDAIGDDASP